jgi:hypothetical protein
MSLSPGKVLTIDDELAQSAYKFQTMLGIAMYDIKYAGEYRTISGNIEELNQRGQRDQIPEEILQIIRFMKIPSRRPLEVEILRLQFLDIIREDRHSRRSPVDIVLELCIIFKRNKFNEYMNLISEILTTHNQKYFYLICRGVGW